MSPLFLCIGNITFVFQSVGTFSSTHIYSIRVYSIVVSGCTPFLSTDSGLDGPGIESPVGRDFPPVHTGPETHPASCTMGTGSFLVVKYGRGVLLTTHPILVPWSWKSRTVPLPTLWATTGPVTGTLYLLLLSCGVLWEYYMCQVVYFSLTVLRFNLLAPELFF